MIIHQLTDAAIGKLLAACYLHGVKCMVHPKWSGLKRPTTKKCLMSGCTCHLFWSFDNAVEEAPVQLIVEKDQ